MTESQAIFIMQQLQRIADALEKLASASAPVAPAVAAAPAPAPAADTKPKGH